MRAQYQKLDNFQDHVDNLVACIKTLGDVVDLQPLFFKLTLDTTTALLFGQSVHSLKARKNDDDDFSVFARSFDIAQGGLAKRFRLAPWHFFYSPTSFRKACSTVHDFVDNYIQGREEKRNFETETKRTDNFVDQLAKESTNHKMLRDQLLNILLAGRDTTACCLSWTV